MKTNHNRSFTARREHGANYYFNKGGVKADAARGVRRANARSIAALRGRDAADVDFVSNVREVSNVWNWD